MKQTTFHPIKCKDFQPILPKHNYSANFCLYKGMNSRCEYGNRVLQTANNGKKGF